MLVLICGLPATGKSNLTRSLARKMKAQILNTDIVRKELFEKPAYSDEEKELVYDVTFLIARYLLTNRRNVIIDGTFYKKRLRDRMREIARDVGTRFKIVECVCPEDVIRKRMARRAERKVTLSDADLEVYEKIKAEFEPIEEDHIVVHTDRYYKENLEYMLKKLRG
ncbi:MAG: AAA family ATPase [Candidatus Hydrothermarchaeales archaeon]